MQSRKRRRSNVMQMMVEPKEIAYRPRHMKAQNTEKVNLRRLRELVDQLPEGTILSVDLEEVPDGQDNG